MIQTKLFSDLYLAKFLNTSAKSFFPCKSNFQRAIFSNKSLSKILRSAKMFISFAWDRKYDFIFYESAGRKKIYRRHIAHHIAL